MRRLVAIAFAAPWVVWALVRVAGVEVPYPFVAALAFTPYAALSSPLPVIAGVLLRRWVVAGVAAVAAVALGLALLPRTVGGPEADAQGPRLTVMTSNLRLGHADARALLRVAREHDVDVLSVQELRPELMRRLDRVGARELFPGRVVDPRLGASGSGVLSRTPLRAVDTSRGSHGPRAAGGRARGRRSAAGPDQGRPPRSAGQPGGRPALAQRDRARCPAATAAATCRSSPGTSTPRSIIPSCAT